MNTSITSLSILALLFTATGALQAEQEPGRNTPADWPCWRGADGDGASTATGIIKDWTNGLKKIWSKDDLCGGTDNEATWSSPAIQAGRMIVPCRQGDDDVIFCLNADSGEVLWKQTYTAKGSVPWGAGPRAMPCIDGERFYTFGCLGHLACWEMKDGKQVWMRNVISDDGGALPKWGFASSPLLDKGKLIVQVGGQCGVAAYDKHTGTPLWTSKTGAAGYAAPVLATLADRRQLLVTDGAQAMALDPETGKTLWTLPRKSNYGMNCATPIVHGDCVLLASNIGTQMIKVGAHGADSVWNIETPERGRGPCHADPVIMGDALYEYTGYPMEDKTLRCLSLKDGKELWTSAELGAGWILPVDGLLLCLSNSGKLALLKPDREKFSKVTEFAAISGKPVWTPPLVVGDKLYVRCKAHLICYQLK